jgi:AcrR family transcriptional regulator
LPRRATSRRPLPRRRRTGPAEGPRPVPLTPRGQATRAALIRSARYIFERDGFVEARITDITAAANAATGSFYSYFSSKEEIFEAVIDKVSDEEGLHPPTMAFLPDVATDDRVARVAAHHREWLRHYARNARLMSVMEEVTNIDDAFRRHRTEAAQPFMRANAEAVRCLQAAGDADPALDPLQTARSLSTMVSRSAFVAFVLEEEGEEALDVLVATLTRLWINALAIPVP